MSNKIKVLFGKVNVEDEKVEVIQCKSCERGKGIDVFGGESVGGVGERVIYCERLKIFCTENWGCKEYR